MIPPKQHYLLVKVNILYSYAVAVSVRIILNTNGNFMSKDCFLASD